jgi:hypothetical protein
VALQVVRVLLPALGLLDNYSPFNQRIGDRHTYTIMSATQFIDVDGYIYTWRSNNFF